MSFMRIQRLIALLLLFVVSFYAILPAASFAADTTSAGIGDPTWIPNGTSYMDSAYTSSANSDFPELQGVCTYPNEPSQIVPPGQLASMQAAVTASIISYESGTKATRDQLSAALSKLPDPSAADGVYASITGSKGEAGAVSLQGYLNEPDDLDGKDNIGNGERLQTRMETIAKRGGISSSSAKNFINTKATTPSEAMQHFQGSCGFDVPVSASSGDTGFIKLIKDPLGWLTNILSTILLYPFTFLYNLASPIAWKYTFFTPHVERGETFKDIAGCSATGAASADDHCKNIAINGFDNPGTSFLKQNNPATQSAWAGISIILRGLLSMGYMILLAVAALMYIVRGDANQNLHILRLIPRLALATILLMTFPVILGWGITVSNILTQSLLSGGHCTLDSINNCNVQSNVSTIINQTSQSVSGGDASNGAGGSIVGFGLKFISLVVSSVFLAILALISFLRQIALVVLVALAPVGISALLSDAWRSAFNKYLKSILAILLAPPLMAIVAILGNALNPLTYTSGNGVLVDNGFSAIVGVFTLAVTFLAMTIIPRMLKNWAVGAGGSSMLTRVSAGAGAYLGTKQGGLAQWGSSRLRGVAARSSMIDQGMGVGDMMGQGGRRMMPSTSTSARPQLPRGAREFQTETNNTTTSTDQTTTSEQTTKNSKVLDQFGRPIQTPASPTGELPAATLPSEPSAATNSARVLGRGAAAIMTMGMSETKLGKATGNLVGKFGTKVGGRVAQSDAFQNTRAGWNNFSQNTGAGRVTSKIGGTVAKAPSAVMNNPVLDKAINYGKQGVQKANQVVTSAPVQAFMNPQAQLRGNLGNLGGFSGSYGDYDGGYENNQRSSSNRSSSQSSSGSKKAAAQANAPQVDMQAILTNIAQAGVAQSLQTQLPEREIKVKVDTSSISAAASKLETAASKINNAATTSKPAASPAPPTGSTKS